MATFVMIHGAFGGGWQWREVAMLLRARGHDVHTPSLTGHGERVHLATPAVGLETHIQDIFNVLRYEELHQVVLAGQSYGGMVITGVADRVPERVAYLVYLKLWCQRTGSRASISCRPPCVNASRNLHGPTARAGLSQLHRWRAIPE
jgi:pimeloyl-ACP methyl ester carboxylesterase